MSEGALALKRPSAAQPLLRVASDERLARLAAEGSTAAFAAIYQRHHQPVYRYCRSILGSEHDACDALQTTMLKAMQALDGESREIALRPWLFRIAHNESISILRRRRTEAPIERASEVASRDLDPETRERARALIADLDQLTVRQRSALVMRELNGLGFAEIAGALETSAAGAKQAVYEARLALHEIGEGREMSCEDVRRKISAEDRRLLRGRGIRSHLKACEDCRSFERSNRSRVTQLAAIAPPLPVPIALGILESVLGGGGGGGIAGGAAALGGGGLSGLTGTGLGAAAAKLSVAGIVALTIGGAVVELQDQDAAAAPNAPDTAVSPPRSGVLSVDAASRDHHGGSDGRSAAGADRGGSARGGGDSGGGDRDGGGGDGSRGGADEAPASAAPTDAPAPAPSAPSTPPVAGGESDSTPPAGGGGPPADHPGGPIGTPPGHGGIPPGQGGVPPGLGTPPPGHTEVPPGHGGTPPGHGGTPPGQGPR